MRDHATAEDAHTYLVRLEDVGEEGVRRAVAVGQANRPANAAAEPGIGLGVAQRVVHRLLLFGERCRHLCVAAATAGARWMRVRISVGIRSGSSEGVGVRSNLAAGFAGRAGEDEEDEGSVSPRATVGGIGTGTPGRRDGREPLWGVQIRQA